MEQQQVPVMGADSTAKIEVNSLHLTGQSLYSENELLALTGFQPGVQLSLGELQAMASRIADFYHRNDYFLAQAYLPAQTIENGVVTIAVVEGRYGDVTLRNQSNLSDGLAHSLLKWSRWRRGNQPRASREPALADVGHPRRQYPIDPGTG
ncbi:MAG: POTRA domain-containing protein [Halomonas sp.]|uniref:POTRA domain-containing protein n=1 Tax=Halomonas sp. TaxID=1486246 RepID=UPI002ACDE5B6|nr:POTRA domain-containing protein [Halomonas sp.]MDZ7851442.1 POTRA domain-containing protein [Halomonas sp.]